MKWTVWVIFAFYPTIVFCQTLSNEYFDRNGEKCAPETSYCYSVARNNGNSFSFDTVKFYFTQSHRLQSIGRMDQFGNPMGLHESFYENGSLKSKRRYEVNRNRKSEPDQDSVGCVILEFYDSLGHSTVQNGEGTVQGRLDFMVEYGKVVNGLRDSVWTVFYENGKVYCYESWRLGQLIDGVSYDLVGKEFYYHDVLVLPEPVGGFQEFYRQASKKIVYPKDAQRRSIEGKVLVEVLIEKDGSVKSPRVVNGIGFGCDEEALKAVMTSAVWMPAIRRGQPVNYRTSIPIVFKLR